MLWIEAVLLVGTTSCDPARGILLLFYTWSAGKRNDKTDNFATFFTLNSNRNIIKWTSFFGLDWWPYMKRKSKQVNWIDCQKLELSWNSFEPFSFLNCSNLKKYHFQLDILRFTAARKSKIIFLFQFGEGYFFDLELVWSPHRTIQTWFQLFFPPFPTTEVLLEEKKTWASWKMNLLALSK